MSSAVKVWDPAIRIFHWGLVTSIAVAWFTADEIKNVHELAGYTAGGLVAARIVMGLVGTRYARFSQFVRNPVATLAYGRDMLKNREARYLGHNPLGAMMILVLIACVSLAALTGWMQTTDAYWGVEWVSDLHEGVVNVLLGCIALHLAGVVLESRRHRENLAAAMITGRKRAPEPEDVI